MRYSETTGCFYPENVNYGDQLPLDIVTVPDEDFGLAMGRPANTKVKLVNGRIEIEEIVRPLAEVRAAVWEQIKAERDLRMDGGFKVEVSTGVFKWYHSDAKSRTQHLALFMAGAAVPPIP